MFNPYDYYITPEEYEIAASNGISKKNLESRIRERGWEKQRAITTPTKGRRCSPEIIALAKANEIKYSQFYTRLVEGWDEHRAATTPIPSPIEQREMVMKMIEKNRKYPLIAIQLAEQNGISVKCFRDRIKRGWDLIRAATLPPSYENSKMRLMEIYGDDFKKIVKKWLFLKSLK
ncbi:hypothetical protein [Gorillibacterium timonense]|uniref:hypothetical protein n=1 Tax=Gorillibacterium timonense TaxID=1689269 RepID=UPI00071D5ABE|nr:hypothetical protein [Gorillibacterium timonense]